MKKLNVLNAELTQLRPGTIVRKALRFGEYLWITNDDDDDDDDDDYDDNNNNISFKIMCVFFFFAYTVCVYWSGS